MEGDGGASVRLTQFSNFAVRILMYAGLKGRRPSAVSEMARAYGVSQEHLKKAAAELCQLGSLESVRGRCGGIQLAKPPHLINIGEVIRKTEAVGSLVECFDTTTSTCPLAGKCKFQFALQSALDAFFSVLDGYTLADLIQDRKALAPLLKLSEDASSQASQGSNRDSPEPWCAASAKVNSISLLLDERT